LGIFQIAKLLIFILMSSFLKNPNIGYFPDQLLSWGTVLDLNGS